MLLATSGDPLNKQSSFFPIAFSLTCWKDAPASSFNTPRHLAICLLRLLVSSSLVNIISFSITLACIVYPKKVSVVLQSCLIMKFLTFFHLKKNVLFAVHCILNILRQHSSYASIFLRSLFLTVQLSQRYIITGKLMPSLSILS